MKWVILAHHKPSIDSLTLYLTRRFSQVKLHDILLKMPRDTTHTKVLQNQRVKLKEKRVKYSPGLVNLQVIGSGAYGAPTSLYLFTDGSRCVSPFCNYSKSMSKCEI